MKPRRTELKRTELRRVTPLKRTGMPRTSGPVKARKVAGNGQVKSSVIPSAIRADVLRRDEFACQRCGQSMQGQRYGLQHRRPRKMGGSKLLHTRANLVVLCGWSVDPGTCTAWVEVEDRLTATALGWLVPNGVTPEEWPVRHFGRWEQPGEIWVLAEPHPRQLELMQGDAA